MLKIIKYIFRKHRTRCPHRVTCEQTTPKRAVLFYLFIFGTGALNLPQQWHSDSAALVLAKKENH